MKKLYLVRHAKSSWDNNNLKDIERPLNKRGKRDAPLMGKLMKQNKIEPEMMITSPAVRAYETAKIFCEEMEIPIKNLLVEKELYEADRKDILNVINHFDDLKSSAMIFSHNPGLTELSKFLTSGDVEDIPTCGVVSIISNAENWNELYDINCSLDFFEYPKKHMNSAT